MVDDEGYRLCQIVEPARCRRTGEFRLRTNQDRRATCRERRRLVATIVTNVDHIYEQKR